MKIRARLIGAIIPAAALLISPACNNGEDPSIISASGYIEATDVRIATKIAGRLDAFPIQEGDTVAANQDLARVDTIDLKLALSVSAADRDFAAAELRLRLAGSRAEDIAEAEAQVTRATVELDAAQRDFDRLQGLLDSGSGTTKSRDDARARRDGAASTLAGVRERFRKMQSGSRPEEIESARARHAAASARVAQIEQQIADATIASPLAGVLTEKLAEPGELLAAGSPIALITDTGHPWLTVYVSERDLGRISIGGSAQVITDDGQTRDGRVTYVSAKSEFTPKNVQTREERVKLVYRVKIGLDNPDGLFKPGMPAEAKIPAAGVAAR